MRMVGVGARGVGVLFCKIKWQEEANFVFEGEGSWGDLGGFGWRRKRGRGMKVGWRERGGLSSWA